ncbi:MAG TPA: hypothetical protein DER43_03445, partial [Clostridiales bacterium]|nr:hypothetical protein [Clostridiales bacterium]
MRKNPKQKRGLAMLCPKCGAQLSDSAVICRACGAMLPEQPVAPKAPYP